MCPHCDEVIVYSSTRVPGGTNDSGALIVICNGCSKDVFIPDVTNPTLGTTIRAGGLLKHAWEHSSAPPVELLPTRLKDVLLHVSTNRIGAEVFALDDTSIYHCDGCSKTVERLIYQEVSRAVPTVQSYMAAAYNFIIKSSVPEPVYIVLRVPATCSCGEGLHATLYCQYSQAEQLGVEAGMFLPCEVKGAENFTQIDGVFTRDQCEHILVKFLMRWKLRFRSTIVATPFVGLNMGYELPEKERLRYLATWDRFAASLDPAATTFITRTKSVSDFKKVSKADGFDLDLLAKYNLLHPSLKNFTKLQRFHAKFYAGLGDSAEVLAGSYNISDGQSAENLVLRKLAKSDFTTRYLDPMGIQNPLISRPEKVPYLLVDLVTRRPSNIVFTPGDLTF
jgi:hypothetical protein